jgi:hypothetical protein
MSRNASSSYKCLISCYHYIFLTISSCHYPISGAPPNSKTPLVIADLARKIATDHNLECKVLGQVDIEVELQPFYFNIQHPTKDSADPRSDH